MPDAELELLTVFNKDDFIIANCNRLPMNLLGKSVFAAKIKTHGLYSVIKSKVKGLEQGQLVGYNKIKMIYEFAAKEAKKDKLKGLVNT